MRLVVSVGLSLAGLALAQSAAAAPIAIDFQVTLTQQCTRTDLVRVGYTSTGGNTTCTPLTDQFVVQFMVDNGVITTYGNANVAAAENQFGVVNITGLPGQYLEPNPVVGQVSSSDYAYYRVEEAGGALPPSTSAYAQVVSSNSAADTISTASHQKTTLWETSVVVAKNTYNQGPNDLTVSASSAEFEQFLRNGSNYFYLYSYVVTIDRSCLPDLATCDPVNEFYSRSYQNGAYYVTGTAVALPAGVPDTPSTFILLGIGLAALAGYRRQRLTS